MPGLNIKVTDKKHNAHAFFELGYMGDKLFASPGVLECLVFELSEAEQRFSFQEEFNNYEVEAMKWNQKG